MLLLALLFFTWCGNYLLHKTTDLLNIDCFLVDILYKQLLAFINILYYKNVELIILFFIDMQGIFHLGMKCLCSSA